VEAEAISLLPGWGDQMGLRLNGWQRIGIVLSVSWFIGCLLYTGHGIENLAEGARASRVSRCYGTFDSAHRLYDPGNEARLVAAEEALKQCKDAAYAAYLLDRKKNGAIARSSFLTDFVPPLIFGWLVVWFAIGITRWIKAGFRACPPDPLRR
jgi:hypothetical protein